MMDTHFNRAASTMMNACGFFRGKHFSEQAFFMGAVILAMVKTTGQHEVIMSWIHSGRTTASQMRIMGLMLCQLPIRIRLSDEENVASLLSRIENIIKEDLDNGIFSLVIDYAGTCKQKVEI